MLRFRPERAIDALRWTALADLTESDSSSPRGEPFNSGNCATFGSTGRHRESSASESTEETDIVNAAGNETATACCLTARVCLSPVGVACLPVSSWTRRKASASAAIVVGHETGGFWQLGWKHPKLGQSPSWKVQLSAAA